MTVKKICEKIISHVLRIILILSSICMEFDRIMPCENTVLFLKKTKTGRLIHVTKHQAKKV
jgi:hypothetical protein